MSAGPESFRSESKFDTLRVPPQSVAAEQSVLGALMLNPAAWPDALELLTEDSFYRRDHRLIFRAMGEVDKQRKPIDAVTLGEWFEANGLGEAIGGTGYLVELASTTPSAANLRSYADIVRQKAMLRQLIEAGTEIVNQGFNPEGRSAVEVIGQASTRIGNLLQAEPCELSPMGPVLDSMFDNLQRRYNANGALDGLSTGFRELDRVLNGLKGGRLYFIASRPKMGKTTLAMNIAEHVALHEHAEVAVYSMEMPREELAERLTSSIGRIPHQNMRTGQLEDDEWSRVSHAIRRLRASPMFLSKPRNVRIESINAQARRRHARRRLGLIVIDYLQLIETSGSENRTQGISEVTRQLKMLAIDLDVPVIALSQLNRKLEDRTNKRPVPADLRDSGSIEQDADAVIFLYRDEVYERDSRDKGTCEVDVALQRNGPAEMVRLEERLDICRFENLADDWTRAPAPEQSEKPAPRKRGMPKVGGKDLAAGSDD